MTNLVNDIDAIDALTDAPSVINDAITLTDDLPRTAAIVADETVSDARALLLAHNVKGLVIDVAALAARNSLAASGLRARLSAAIRAADMTVLKAGKGNTDRLYIGRGTVAYVAPTE